MVDLFLGVMEDWVCGMIDLEKVFIVGVKVFELGLFVKVNCGILYVDEVNLLDDYFVDVFLDVVVFGWNIVEREGILISYLVCFILVGFGNLEEGELCF